MIMYRARCFVCGWFCTHVDQLVAYARMAVHELTTGERPATSHFCRIIHE
jgi:hypothetical protein